MTPVVIVMLLAAAAQGFVFWRKNKAHRQAEEDTSLFYARQGEDGHLFMPASLSYYRSLYIDPQGFRVETEGQPLDCAWEEVVVIHKVPNPDRKTLRDTYRLLVSITGRPDPLVIQLGSFRDAEVRLIIKTMKKYARVIEE